MSDDWSDDILIAKLPAEPRTSDELDAVTRIALDKPQSDLIVDFGGVDKVTCQSLCELLRLHSIVSDRGRRCLFCNVGTVTRGIFSVYGFDRVFEMAGASEVVFEPSIEHVSGGKLELRSLDSSEPLPRRNYSRLKISSSLQVNVLLWQGNRSNDNLKLRPGHYWHGKLVDISEGGAQIAVDATEDTAPQKGLFIGVEFRPKPDETVPAFSAQIREVLPTADGENVCLGIQFIGLEANPESCQSLERLCNLEGIYCAAKEQAAICR